jgi:hypothetical protein
VAAHCAPPPRSFLSELLWKEVTRKKGAEGRGEMEGIEQRKQGRMKEKNTYKEVGLFIYLWWTSRQLSWYSDQTMEWTTEECWFNSRQWQERAPSLMPQGRLFSASFSTPFTIF